MNYQTALGMVRRFPFAAPATRLEARYGSRKISEIRKEWNALREAVRCGEAA